MSERYYTLATHTASQYNEVCQELTTSDPTPDTIPDRAVTISDSKNHSQTKGEFLLTDDEATSLKTDSRIKFINLTPARYPEIYNATEDDLRLDVPNGETYNRYNSTNRNWHFWANNSAISGSFSENTAADLNRASSQLIRLEQKSNPWISGGTSSSNYIDRIPNPHGAGEDVDVICADNGTWIGHVEFINNDVSNAVNPINYVGGNVLPGGGYCDVLDVALDGPYYIDPDWFNADASRLTTRFDGTTVPTESAAHDWWRDSTKRSSEFAAFGNILISTSYTRARVHGDNNAVPTGASANHGTQCASLIYGRTHGWAYNCNKWHLNLYSNYSLGSIELGFDVCKIFHQYKPTNSKYGTKDPTLMNNSWGYRADKSSSFYFFQSSTGVSYPGSSDEPEFLKYMGVDGDLGRWKSEMIDNSMTEAGKELVDAGVLFIAAAGNSGQMQVEPDDANYDNHIASTNTASNLYDTTFTEFGYSVSSSTNRRGFPQHIGKTESETFQGNTTIKFPAINVGALDDAFATGPKERKVNYSDMGSAIDVFAPADGTLAATVGTYGTDVARRDSTYTDSSLTSRDTRFSGTSAACPVACGFLATVMQYNRNWTYENLRNWIDNNLEEQDSATFYDDTRGTTAEGTEWSDRNRLQGAVRRVIYKAQIPITTPNPEAQNEIRTIGPISLRNGLQLRR